MELEQLPPITIAAFRHVGKHEPFYTDDTWERLILWASPKRLLGRDPDIRGVGLLWDDPRIVPADGRRYDAGVPIFPEDIPAIEHPALVLITMPGEYMHVRQVGPYSQLPQTYQNALGLTMRAEGLELAAAPIIELYRNSPSEVSSDELITDIYLPLVAIE